MSVATARHFVLRVIVAGAVTSGILAAWAGQAMAQGVTTGAARGRILDTAGQPVAGASVLMIGTERGTRFAGTTNATGAFFIANVVLGTYTVEARAIGFRPERRSDIVVTLGRVTDVELRLEPSTVELEAITTVAQNENVLLAPSRTGPISVVDSNLLSNLPSLNRNFLDFSRTNSMVNGSSIAGQSDRFNQLQIDGGSNGDLFGLNGSGGQPGGANNSRPLSIEAIQEVQVLIAPFDVRQGGFTGGLINAVTKSGSNEFHGSAFYSLQNDGLVGKDSAGNRASDFSLGYYGFSLGGPIMRDRLHFFVAGEWRTKTEPFGGVVVIGSDTTGGADSINVGIRSGTADRIRQYTQTTYGFDPGNFGRPSIPNPDMNIFAKLSAQVGSRGQAELSYTHVTSSRLALSHTPTSPSLTNIRDGYQFENSGYDNDSHTNGMRFRLNTPFGTRFTNELIVSYNYLSDERTMGSPRPIVVVGGDRRAVAGVCNPFVAPVVTTGCPTTFLALGGERFSHANILHQKILEVANNLTVELGSHVLTLGGRAERFNFLNVFFPGSLGAWSFPDSAAYFGSNNGGVPQPSRYEIALPGIHIDSARGRADGPIADFVFSQFGLYAQDQVRVTPALTLTFGTRFDFTSLPQPTYNRNIDSGLVTAGPNAGGLFGVRTDTKVTSAMLFSPRFGFNYDIRGDRSLVLRGGLGIFNGRTPYVWASNAYTNTGLEQVTLICDGPLSSTGGTTDAPPPFTFDPTAQPRACAGPATITSLAPSIVYFDKNFKLPQNFRASLGLDRSLPWGMLGSFDALFTRAVNQFLLEDVNLVQGGTSVGEANRAMYGTITGSTIAPRRATAAARDVLRQFNSNQDYSYSLTFSLNKRFSNAMEFTAGYTFSHAYDLISGTSDISNSLLRFSILDGTFANRNLRNSLWDTPHSIRISGAANLPYGVRLSLFYTGQSGRPYSYTSASDLNADGLAGNDLIYVPINSQDISLVNPAQWTTLNNYINAEPCLNKARGTIIQRTSCRNPWRTFLDARAVKSFRTIRGQSVEVMASLFNVLSFLSIGGKINSTTGFENANLLSLARYDAALGRGVYNLALPNNGNRLATDVNASRWKLELGARYIF